MSVLQGFIVRKRSAPVDEPRSGSRLPCHVNLSQLLSLQVVTRLSPGDQRGRSQQSGQPAGCWLRSSQPSSSSWLNDMTAVNTARKRDAGRGPVASSRGVYFSYVAAAEAAEKRRRPQPASLCRSRPTIARQTLCLAEPRFYAMTTDDWFWVEEVWQMQKFLSIQARQGGNSQARKHRDVDGVRRSRTTRDCEKSPDRHVRS